MGVPVLSTAVLGTREVLQDANGACVVDEDAEAFSREAAALLGCPDCRAAGRVLREHRRQRCQFTTLTQEIRQLRRRSLFPNLCWVSFGIWQTLCLERIG